MDSVCLYSSMIGYLVYIHFYSSFDISLIGPHQYSSQDMYVLLHNEDCLYHSHHICGSIYKYIDTHTEIVVSQQQ